MSVEARSTGSRVAAYVSSRTNASGGTGRGGLVETTVSCFSRVGVKGSFSTIRIGNSTGRADMRYPNEEIENYRKNAGDLENTLIDEFRDGELSRRELFQRGALLGMSLPFLGLLAGGAETALAAPTRAAARRAGGT